MKRTIAIAVAALFTSLLCFLRPGDGLAAEKVRFALDWLPLGNNTPFFVAVDKGFYQAAGLDVSIVRGFGSHDTAKKVLAGAMDFGVADVASILLARSENTKNVIVSIVADRELNVVYALKGSGITKPSDLSGRSIGDSVGGAGIAIFPAFAQINQIRDWKFQPMTPAAKFGMLISGKVDAILTVEFGFPALDTLAKKQGKELVSLPYRDYGLDIYAKGILTRGKTIQERRGTVKAFVEASMKAYAWTVEHPEEGVSLFLKRHPTQNPSTEKARWKIAQEVLFSPSARAHGIGFVDAEKMKKTIEILSKYQNLPASLSPQEVYTNEFLPRLFPKAPKNG